MTLEWRNLNGIEYYNMNLYEPAFNMGSSSMTLRSPARLDDGSSVSSSWVPPTCCQPGADGSSSFASMRRLSSCSSRSKSCKIMQYYWSNFATCLIKTSLTSKSSSSSARFPACPYVGMSPSVRQNSDVPSRTILLAPFRSLVVFSLSTSMTSSDFGSCFTLEIKF